MAEKKFKSRYIACIIYPDNADQMDFMRYLINHEECVWILHEAEPQALPLGDTSEDEAHDHKAHYHL